MSTTRCDTIRLDLSARLDGEGTDLSADRLDAHLAGCDGCRAWLAQAERVTRQARVRSVEVPDLTGRILAAVADERRAEVAARRTEAAERAVAARGIRQILRLAVGIAAVVQLAMALPVLVGASIDPHLSREMASFDIAVAVGFALAAWRPERARAFVPVAFVLAACLVLTSGLDVADGATRLAHEMGHLAALVQAVLLWALGRRSTDPVPPAAAAPRQATPTLG